MISLVVLLCHSLNGAPTPVCVEEIIPQITNRLAGLVSSPLPMAKVDMFECRITSLPVIAQWLTEHSIYHSWEVVSWGCFRDYVPKGRA